MSLMHAKGDAAPALPPIDLDVPTDLQTATFSLG